METVLNIVDDKTGELVNEVRTGDRFTITRKEQLEYMREQSRYAFIDKKEPFIKLLAKALDDLCEENLTSAEYKVITKALNLLKYDSCLLMNNNEYVTNDYFIKECKLTKKTVIVSINKLIKKGIMAKGLIENKKMLFVNPYIFMKGVKVLKIELQMFSRTRWAKNIEFKN